MVDTVTSNENLVLQIQNGNNAALTDLYLQTEKLIRKTCLPFTGSSVHDLEDLVQEGYFILEAAAQSYDPGSPVSFAGWLCMNLRWQLPRIINRMRNFKIPEYRLNRIGELEKAEAKGLSPKDIRRLYKWNDRTYQQARSDRKLLQNTSLDKCTSEDLTVADMIGEEDPGLEAVEDRLLDIQLWNEVDKLPDRQSEVIRKHYRENLPLTEINKGKGYSYQYTAQLHKNALRKLRKNKQIREILLAKGYQGSGLSAFRRSGSSVTEYLAIRLAGLPKA